MVDAGTRRGNASLQLVALTLGVSRSLGARAGTMAISAAVTLMNTRLVYSYCGSSAFAVVTTISSVMALLPFGDLGTGAAITNAVAAGDRGVALGSALRTGVRRSAAFAAIIAMLSAVAYGTHLWPTL